MDETVMDETAMDDLYLTIPKTRAEFPALIVLAIVCFVGWAFHYSILGWEAGLVWLGVIISLLFWLYKKRSSPYFVQSNAEGISFRLHFFSTYMMIPWKYLQRIDYLEYEINFMLKETAQVVSLATSGLNDAQTEQLKEHISHSIANHSG